MMRRVGWRPVGRSKLVWKVESVGWWREGNVNFVGSVFGREKLESELIGTRLLEESGWHTEFVVIFANLDEPTGEGEIFFFLRCVALEYPYLDARGAAVRRGRSEFFAPTFAAESGAPKCFDDDGVGYGVIVHVYVLRIQERPRCGVTFPVRGLADVGCDIGGEVGKRDGEDRIPLMARRLVVRRGNRGPCKGFLCALPVSFGRILRLCHHACVLTWRVSHFNAS